MLDDLSQLDELVEEDMLAALGQPSVNKNENINQEVDEIIIEDFHEELKIEENIISENNSCDDIDKNAVKSDDTIISTIKTDELASLLSQLLNNRTIEITIKIKD